jgi:FAD-dependent urate hydroxylase
VTPPAALALRTTIRVAPIPPLRIAIVGAGTAGPAAAAFLAADGHEVHIFERAASLRPVGAGLLLQPTGLSVLRRLSLLKPALSRGSIIRRLFGHTLPGGPVLEVEYASLRPDLFGLGIHRALLLELLLACAANAGATLHQDRDVLSIGDPAHPILRFREGPDFPCDLCIVASGARSLLRQHAAFGARERPYPWGALWTIAPDPEQAYGDTLHQIYDNAHTMLGFLPSGSPSAQTPPAPTVSMFWSTRVDQFSSHFSRPIEEWKDRVAAFSPRAAPILAHVHSWSDVAPATYVDVRLGACWSGRTVIIGDAAHAMSPQLGQGANLALMDAAALRDHLSSESTVTRALAAYARARRAHTSFYQFASRALTPVFQGDHESVGPVRDTFMHPLSRIGWLNRQFLESLVGVKTGLLSAMPLPPPVAPQE